MLVLVCDQVMFHCALGYNGAAATCTLRSDESRKYSYCRNSGRCVNVSLSKSSMLIDSSSNEASVTVLSAGTRLTASGIFIV